MQEIADWLEVSSEKLQEKLARIRHIDVPEYLDELVDTFPWQEATVVGFSSTFQQNTASFALARRLKERYPYIFILFGGANFDGDMGLEFVRALDYIDAAVIGEGDDAFPNLLNALATGADPELHSRRSMPPRRAGQGNTARPADHQSGRSADSGLRRVLQACGGHRNPAPCRAPEGLASHRDRPRMLVGRKTSLHILWAQCNDNAFPVQVASTRSRRIRSAGAAIPKLPLRSSR